MRSKLMLRRCCCGSEDSFNRKSETFFVLFAQPKTDTSYRSRTGQCPVVHRYRDKAAAVYYSLLQVRHALADSALGCVA